MRAWPKDTKIQSISKFRAQIQNSKLRALFPNTASFMPFLLYPSEIYYIQAIGILQDSGTAGQDGTASWLMFLGS